MYYAQCVVHNALCSGDMRRPMAVSLKEIAQKAGVSPGTVSHVLNGRETARISQATQDKVRAVAEDLGYQPNRLARSLWRGRTDTIGLMVAGLRNPFFVELMEASEEAITRAGYQALVDAGPSVKGTYFRHNPIHNWPVDGALAWVNPDQVLTAFTGASGETIPTVYLGYPRADRSDWVAFDLRQGADDLALHMVQRCKGRLGFVSAYGEEKLETEPRFQAYRAACRKAGLGIELFTTENEEETREASLRIGLRLAAMPPSDRPSGFMCHNDVLAIGLICGLKRGGLRVPQDAAVAGFDGIEEGLYLPEPLTTVRTSPALLAESAVEILLHRLAHPDEEEKRSVLHPCHLRDGGTT
jgi:LacI family transcriptional regulator